MGINVYDDCILLISLHFYTYAMNFCIPSDIFSLKSTISHTNLAISNLFS